MHCWHKPPSRDSIALDAKHVVSGRGFMSCDSVKLSAINSKHTQSKSWRRISLFKPHNWLGFYEDDNGSSIALRHGLFQNLSYNSAATIYRLLSLTCPRGQFTGNARINISCPRVQAKDIRGLSLNCLKIQAKEKEG